MVKKIFSVLPIGYIYQENSKVDINNIFLEYSQSKYDINKNINGGFLEKVYDYNDNSINNKSTNIDDEIHAIFN